MGARHRPRCDPDRLAAVFERLSLPCGQQGLDRLVHQAPPIFPASAGGVILEGPIAEPRDEAEATLADEVEDRDVLREAHRVVERDEQCGHRDADAPCSCDDHGRKRQR